MSGELGVSDRQAEKWAAWRLYCTVPDEQLWFGLKDIISDWPSFPMCPYCYNSDCANLKNSAAMCPGPAP